MTIECPPALLSAQQSLAASPSVPTPGPRSWAPAAAGGLPPPFGFRRTYPGFQDTGLPLATHSLSLPDHLSSLTSREGGAGAQAWLSCLFCSLTSSGFHPGAWLQGSSSQRLLNTQVQSGLLLPQHYRVYLPTPALQLDV